MTQHGGDVIHTEDVSWLPLAPRVSMRPLRLDDHSGAFTVMIRAMPGAILPRHKHLALSEIYVLKGASTHPQTGYTKPGDYISEHAGAIHDPLHFEEETILFMVSHGPSVFLNDDDSTAFVMDVASVRRLQEEVQK